MMWKEAALKLGCGLREKEPMSLHTTFHIGGAADLFFTVETTRQLSGLLELLQGERIPCFLLGKGSNLLVSDKGIRGAVICLSGDFKKIELLPDGVTLRAGAGASLASLCAFARDRALTGLEFAWGIPGSVGGAVYMNAGAYGGEIKDVIARARHMSPRGEREEVPAKELGLSYRRSRYTGGQDVILSADFALQRGNPAEIEEKMEELMARRKEKQPYDKPSAGSVFKRPANGYAAALIQDCGLKGARSGGAQVSEKHSGFIVNTGGATCEDVLSLVEKVRKTVEEQTGTRLECEIRTVGEF